MPAAETHVSKSALTHHGIGCPYVSALADQVDDHPMVFPLLNLI